MQAQKIIHCPLRISHSTKLSYIGFLFFSGFLGTLAVLFMVK